MRAFYKLRFFWCGVPGLVFLLWAWWDSGGYDSFVMWNGGRQVHDLRVIRGEATWGSMRNASGVGGAAGFSWGRHEVRLDDGNGWMTRGERRLDFARAAVWNEEVIEAGGRRAVVRDVRVALWVVMAAYVVVWLGAVIAWGWRQARVMRRLTESEVGKEVEG